MTDQSIFSDNEKPQETPVKETTENNSLFADQLSKIVNERGEPKYKTVEDALEGNAHAQKYITELKQELETIKTSHLTVEQELAKRKSVEEALERLAPRQDQQAEPKPNGLDGDELARTVEELLNKRENTTKQQQNFESVVSSISSQYGDKAAEQIGLKAKELGVTKQELEQMAREKPSLVLQLFNLKQQSSSNVTSSGQRVPSDYTPRPDETPRPTKSMMSGATTRERVAYLQEIRKSVYSRNNVQK